MNAKRITFLANVVAWLMVVVPILFFVWATIHLKHFKEDPGVLIPMVCLLFIAMGVTLINALWGKHVLFDCHCSDISQKPHWHIPWRGLLIECFGILIFGLLMGHRDFSFLPKFFSNSFFILILTSLSATLMYLTRPRVWGEQSLAFGCRCNKVSKKPHSHLPTFKKLLFVFCAILLSTSLFVYVVVPLLKQLYHYIEPTPVEQEFVD